MASAICHETSGYCTLTPGSPHMVITISWQYSYPYAHDMFPCCPLVCFVASDDVCVLNSCCASVCLSVFVFLVVEDFFHLFFGLFCLSLRWICFILIYLFCLCVYYIIYVLAYLSGSLSTLVIDFDHHPFVLFSSIILIFSILIIKETNRIPWILQTHIIFNPLIN